jgi:hypothetical protein
VELEAQPEAQDGYSLAIYTETQKQLTTVAKFPKVRDALEQIPVWRFCRRIHSVSAKTGENLNYLRATHGELFFNETFFQSMKSVGLTGLKEVTRHRKMTEIVYHV